MQKWTRQTQCILCELRVGLKQKHNPQTRSYGSSSVRLSGRQSATRSVRFHLSSDLDAQRPPPKADPTKTRVGPVLRKTDPQTKYRRPDQSHQDKEETSERRAYILRALQRVKTDLIRSTMGKGSSITQMHGLDPTRTLWSDFESLIRGALSAGPITSARVGIIGNLMNARDEDFRPSVQRALRFAFLDYVLDHGNGVKVGGPEGIDLRYPTEWYPQTRQLQRVIHLHVGPTNSGKTYNALKRLEEAQNGFYAGPLRLLAHEVYSRFNNRGIKCDLVTGDDVRLDASGEVTLYASTVEMVDTVKVADVGVIDEIQMLGDKERGWAWTRALLAVRVKELHLCGEARVVPLIREIVASMGDTLHIHQYERLNPLKVMSKSLKGNLQNLRKGDCVVSFSIVNIHALKRQIELDTGKRCAIIYGSLPPETRAQQAALFNDPDNDYDYLVASDAIGMGLNLSIKRVVFETTKKWNGTHRVQLTIPQIKQIAGRAGRYRTARDDSKAAPAIVKADRNAAKQKPDQVKSIGLVTCIDEADLPVLHTALSQDGPPLRTAGILPPGEFYEDLASRLPYDTPFEYILRRMSESVATNDRFLLCNLKDQFMIARALEDILGLSIADRLTLCAAPASFSNAISRTAMQETMVALAKAIESDTPVTVADITEIPLETLDDKMSDDRHYLASLETLHKALVLFIWLSYRFPRILRDQDMAVRAKELCEEKINTTLLRFSANPQLRLRLAEIRKSSELLRDQAKANGWVPPGSGLIMNPDQSVEEVESALVNKHIENEHEASEGLQEHVEVEGELDLGGGEVLDDAEYPTHEVVKDNPGPDRISSDGQVEDLFDRANVSDEPHQARASG